MSISSMANVTNFTQCVLELVLNALHAKATAIAIRFHIESRKIQVIDNGTGMPKRVLEHIAEYNEQRLCSPWNMQDSCNVKNQTLTNIRRLCDTMIITSRHCDTLKTYAKVFKMYCPPRLIRAMRRPSTGTTVSIYSFYELPLKGTWNISLMYFLIANIALVNTQVSFSIRDDQRGKVIMSITKPHNPVKIFKLLYDAKVTFRNIWYMKSKKDSNPKFQAFVGLNNVQSKAIQYVFLNNKPIEYPLILQLISNAFIETARAFLNVNKHWTFQKERVFILLFIKCKEYIFTIERGRKTLILPSIQNLLEGIRHGILSIFKMDCIPISIWISPPRLKYKNLLHSYPNNLDDSDLFNNMMIAHQTQTFKKLCSASSRRNVINYTDLSINRLQISHTKYDNFVGKYKEPSKYKNTGEFSISLNDKTTTKSLSKYSRIVRTKVTKLKITETRTLSINQRKFNAHSISEVNSSNFLKNNDTVPTQRLMSNATMSLMDHSSSIAKQHLMSNIAMNQSDMNYLSNDLFTPVQQNKDSIELFTMPLSEWSNWSYPDRGQQNLTTQNVALHTIMQDANSGCYKRFEFLPNKLRRLLQPSNMKLTKLDCLGGSGRSILSAKLKLGLPVANTLYHQEMDVRFCKSTRKFHEFRLRKELLKHFEVLGQINNEFIAGLIIKKKMKVLMLMDQHAVHERIRYESLLDKYKSQKQDQLVSVKLKDSIPIQLSSDMYNLLLSNEMTLKKFGIKLNFISENIALVRSVPEYLKRNKYYDAFKVKTNVENLLREISQNLATTSGYRRINSMPFIIHNAITTEACHGAIKFGDPLTLKQCKWLVKVLIQTRIPTRCAHGRPSIAPIIDLSELEGKYNKILQKKLNFGALKALRKKK